MIGPSPQWYIQSFVKIGLLVPKKKIQKVLTIYGCGGHLGHVTEMLEIKFWFSLHGGSTQNLALIGQAVSEEKFGYNGHIHVYSPRTGQTTLWGQI